MAESNQAQREAYDVHFASVVALGKSGTAMSRARFGLDWAMSNPHSPQLNAQLERARMLLGESDTWWRSFRDLPKTRELQRLTDDLDAKRTAVRRDGIDQLIDAIRTGDASWMDETRANRLIAWYTAMNASQGALEAYLNQQAADANERSAVLFHGLLSASIGSVLIGLTVAFFSWRTLRRAIMDPLHAALHQFDAIAAGELTTRVAIRSKDEMATLLRGLASMQDKLCATVTNVRAGSGESRRHADGRGDPAERGARGGKRGDRELARGSGAAVERTDWGIQSCARLNRLATARSERIASRLMPIDAAGCLPTLRVAIHCLIHCFTQPDENLSAVQCIRATGAHAGILRNEMAKRFHALIAEISSVRSTSSSSPKCGRTASQTASGTWSCETSVRASVHSSAARSRSVKNGVSRQVTTVARRRSVSPALRASAVCMSTQKAQPLICDARRRTRSASDFSIDDFPMRSSRPSMALMAAGPAL
jgi:hypothetical protein